MDYSNIIEICKSLISKYNKSLNEFIYMFIKRKKINNISKYIGGAFGRYGDTVEKCGEHTVKFCSKHPKEIQNIISIVSESAQTIVPQIAAIITSIEPYNSKLMVEIKKLSPELKELSKNIEIETKKYSTTVEKDAQILIKSLTNICKR